MLHRQNIKLQFSSKRNKRIVTPCCGKSNTDSKFVNYKGFPSQYGYCHSCGESITPPTVYHNEKGETFVWDDDQKEIIPLNDTAVTIGLDTRATSSFSKKASKKYISMDIVNRTMKTSRENNLLVYLLSKYPKSCVDRVKAMYYIGTSKKGYTVFWEINHKIKPQKAKAVLYDIRGRRTDNFLVPYKNRDGYYSCLYGEHLLQDNDKPIMLVESEKTAIVAAIVFPKYTWLAYGGINGLTKGKIAQLRGLKVTIIPDFSEKALEVIQKKKDLFTEYQVDAQICDFSEGQSDTELEACGLYNADLEDLLRCLS